MAKPIMGRIRLRPLYGAFVRALLAMVSVPLADARAAEGVRTINADVVALDQPFLWNRLGVSEPGGMVYALAGDVVSTDHDSTLRPGKVTLRAGKRPRPIVLRANVGDRLRIKFRNLLDTKPVNGSAATRYAGVHITGLELLDPAGGTAGINSDGSWVGRNRSSLAAPGDERLYEYYAKGEGTFLLYSAADNDNDQGPTSAGPTQVSLGLFGAVNVQPEWAEWYRSQVTRDDLLEATLRIEGTGPTTERRLSTPKMMSVVPQTDAAAQPKTRMIQRKRRRMYTLRAPDAEKHTVDETDAVEMDGRLYSPLLQPLIDYHAVYPSGPRVGLPILKMLRAVPVVPAPAGFPLFVPSSGSSGAEVRQAIDELNRSSGRAYRALQAQNTRRQIQLSPRMRVTDEGENTWLFTSPGRGLYLIRLEDDPAGGKRFRFDVAELHLVHSDLTAIITGPDAERWPTDINSPSFFSNPVLPDRRQPYREFTIVYHQASGQVQPFPQYYNQNTSGAFGSVTDSFAINYGMAGIGSEILANRLGVGPMGNADAVDLKYEEFFLSAWAVGDPAMVVDVPANSPNQAVSSPSEGSRVSQQALFTLDVTDADSTVVELNNQRVNTKLGDAFKAHGVVLSGTAIASTISAGNQWIVLDPYSAQGPLPTNRNRYPIVATGTNATGATVVTTLTVYSGFPINLTVPAVPAFNALSKTKATKALFADDPSNVYHSNIRDHVKFRILHAGPGPSHVHHLHAHQWLHGPGSPNSQYLDSQLIVPGSAYTLDIVHGGSGNRNLTVGDSIFHCHFYPHFAQGMWSLWRTHDVFESGTWLDVNGRPVTHVTDADGKETPVYPYTKDNKTHFFYYDEKKVPHEVTGPVLPAWNRALPDGEIEAGTPIPAIVPLPGLAMPLIPSRVRLTDLAPVLSGGSEGQGRRVEVEIDNAEEREEARLKGVKVPGPEYENPGYPFFIPGIAGHRPPHPPLDFAHQKDVNGVERELNGGLPRHVVLSGTIVKEYHTRWDFTRDFIEYDPNQKQTPISGKLIALRLPENGTPYEKAAMAHHSQRTHRSYLPDNDQGNITRNGLTARHGAPFAPPEVDDYGNAELEIRRYQAAVIQTDVVLNKQGWHFPQQRFLNLWEDVGDTLAGKRAPQPLFFRSNTNDTIEFWHTNLVPSYYELDDFQVRTPTDVIGQHIHNVKFDVTASDGSANGYNYEDGTFSPDEVRDRINALNRPVAETQLAFERGNSLPDLGPQKVGSEQTWGTAPQAPGTVLARAVVRNDAVPGSTVGFFCSKHGRPMSGSLSVRAAGTAGPKSVEIQGTLPGGKPTWVADGKKAEGVEVGPGDTVVWKAVDGEHGVVFDPDGILQFDDVSGFVDVAKKPETLTIVKVADAYPPQGGVGTKTDGVFGPPPAGQNWDEAPRPPFSAGIPTRCWTTSARSERFERSSRTTTWARLPTSRPGFTRALWSNRKTRSGICPTAPP